MIVTMFSNFDRQALFEMVGLAVNTFDESPAKCVVIKPINGHYKVGKAQVPVTFKGAITSRRQFCEYVDVR